MVERMRVEDLAESMYNEFLKGRKPETRLKVLKILLDREEKNSKTQTKTKRK